jgi:hypothetical protein
MGEIVNIFVREVMKNDYVICLMTVFLIFPTLYIIIHTCIGPILQLQLDEDIHCFNGTQWLIAVFEKTVIGVYSELIFVLMFH